MDRSDVVPNVADLSRTTSKGGVIQLYAGSNWARAIQPPHGMRTPFPVIWRVKCVGLRRIILCHLYWPLRIVDKGPLVRACVANVG